MIKSKNNDNQISINVANLEANSISKDVPTASNSLSNSLGSSHYCEITSQVLLSTAVYMKPKLEL